MGLKVVIALIVAVIALIAFWFKKKFSYWEDRGFKFIKPEFPFGNLRGVGFKVHLSQVLQKFYEQYKRKEKAIGIFFFTSPIVLITDLETVKHVLLKDFSNFHDRGLYFNEKSDPLSAHLITIEGPDWKNMRAKLTPTFTSGKMKMMFGTVSDICKEMINHLNTNEKSTEIEMKDILARLTTDVIGNVVFGLDLNSMENPDTMFRKMGRKVFDRPPGKNMKVLFLTTFRSFSRRFGLMYFDQDVSDFFLSSIRETVEYREKNDIKRNDFLSLLLQIKNHGKINDEAEDSLGKLTFEQLAAQAFVFFLAGFETSSTTMTFALYEMALNPEIQQKLRDDIKSVLSRHDNKLNYEGMLEMKYLQMVIDETLRKYPPVDKLVRIASNDYKIPDSKLFIEKDTLVLVPVYAIHHDADIFPEPEKFDPERFSDANKKDHHPMAHLPFGEGPRNCIGERFGLMQTKIGLVELLTNFKFSPSHKTTIPMTFSPSTPLLAPVNDMWLQVEKL